MRCRPFYSSLSGTEPLCVRLIVSPWRSGARLREVARLKHRERVNDLLPKSVAASDIEINGSIEPVKDFYHAQCMVNCRSAWQPIGQAM